MRSPLHAQVVEWLVAPGALVHEGDVVLVLEAMKMEHEIRAPATVRVRELLHAPGDTVAEGDVLWAAEPALAEAPGAAPAAPAPTDASRADLQRLQEREALTRDAARPDAVARRHALGLRTARENVADLCDPGSFDEYGAFAIAAQTSRRPVDELRRQTPADGMVTGIGGVNGALFAPERARTAVLAYDATVLAGTQGFRNHQKTDRLLGVAARHRLPVVLFAEGGGGRPGDADMPIVAGLHVPTFAAFARLNGVVPTIGIAAGRCFAGNAALLGCCDLIIATRDATIGMGGPAMVEGGGLGRFAPEDIGPAADLHRNGVIDLLADDEAHAVRWARQCLAIFQGALPDWETPDVDALPGVVPENRLRAYDTRAAIHGIADVGTVLELRTGFGQGIHTGFARIEGRAIGWMANNPAHLGGAIDADAADKAARFLQLCNAHGLPMVSLVDTPGFMVGPDIERRAQVRHVSRMFIAAAHLQVPLFAVVLRKGYGLGAMAMAAGGFHEPAFTVAWPTGEFGGMGLEGAVKLGYRKELHAQPEGPQREALYERLLARQYENGQALRMAETLEIDAVIEPARTRDWLARGLAAARPSPDVPRHRIDAW
ncbi:carboxyl transferase domain-containing protein [Ramlibacter algicola]|uniref:carboxyl transferase domain-containing protein n=1 Tax=Ramlibacter algicola TaxID=2795217 RepID=UPI001EF088DC|nr:carboxyl transferase domain-containing protein [Ramlibacter algicola]